MECEENVPALVVSVDPGANGGWALWRGGLYSGSGIMNGDHIHPIYRLIGGLTEENKQGRKVLVLEDQYIGNNWKTGKVLISRRMRWQAMAELFGWEVILVFPAKWQSRVLSRMPGQDTKEKSMFLAETIVGKKPYTHDLADAICIGEFWIREARLPKQAGLPLSTPRKKRTSRKKGS